MAKYFIAATPKVYIGGYEEWSWVYHSIFWNSAMASSTFLSSASVCWSWGVEQRRGGVGGEDPGPREDTNASSRAQPRVGEKQCNAHNGRGVRGGKMGGVLWGLRELGRPVPPSSSPVSPAPPAFSSSITDLPGLAFCQSGQSPKTKGPQNQQLRPQMNGGAPGLGTQDRQALGARL